MPDAKPLNLTNNRRLILRYIVEAGAIGRGHWKNPRRPVEIMDRPNGMGDGALGDLLQAGYLRAVKWPGERCEERGYAVTESGAAEAAKAVVPVRPPLRVVWVWSSSKGEQAIDNVLVSPVETTIRDGDESPAGYDRYDNARWSNTRADAVAAAVAAMSQWAAHHRAECERYEAAAAAYADANKESPRA